MRGPLLLPSTRTTMGHVSGRIYSVGYEGFDVDGLVERLAASKVSAVIDVRLDASSRRPGFSRKALSTH